MSLSAKLLEVQREGVELVKDARNPHFRNSYITLDKLLEAVIPILNSKDIVLLQMPATTETGQPALTTMFVDTETGDTFDGTMPLILQKQDPQGVGSAITYARRYMLMSALGLVADEDDDGNAGSSNDQGTENAPVTTGTWG